MSKRIRALSIMSGGLDSILATRIVMGQGVDVTGVHFVTPFFGSIPGPDEDPFQRRMEQYGIRAVTVDISDDYIKMLGSPQYGYGKNFNPCVDCKILLLSKARSIMEEWRIHFIVSGEVLGQRPMSQRRDTLRVIERDSLTSGRLLRPLSAKLLKPTIPETEGWVRREDLFGFSGRSRKPQMALASRLGITGYPAPAGGCCLTDPIQAGRIRRLYGIKSRPGPREIKLIQLGRPFNLGRGVILTIGRNEGENDTIQGLAQNGDILLKMADVPGPLGIIMGSPEDDQLTLAGGLLAYHSKARTCGAVNIEIAGPSHETRTVREVTPAAEEAARAMRF